MLRLELEEITKIKDISKHQNLLEDLRNEHSHSIKVIDSYYPIDRYTCFVHAFDFTEKEQYIQIATFGLCRVFAEPRFGQWYIDSGKLKEASKKVLQESLIFYFHNNELQHVGLIQPSLKVISKWGVGNLYEHEIFEVPLCYGDEIRVFEKPSCEEALLNFKCYAKEEFGYHFNE